MKNFIEVVEYITTWHSRYVWTELSFAAKQHRDSMSNPMIISSTVFDENGNILFDWSEKNVK